MEPTDVKRNLAVILADHAKGDASPLRADEGATLKTLGPYRTILDSLNARHEAVSTTRPARSSEGL